MQPADDYNYETAGFDSFLSRSVDSLSQVTLDSQGPFSTAQRFDSSQITGALGDKFSIGLISLDGPAGIINVTDTQGETSIKLGDPNDPGQLLVPQGAIYIYDRDKNPTIINGRIVGSKTLDKFTLNTAFSTHVGVGDDGMEWLPKVLSFTVPDGVTLIKLTLNCAAAVEGTNANGHFNSLYINESAFNPSGSVADDAKCLFVMPNTNTGSSDVPGTGFWYVPVVPGQIKTYYLGLLVPFSISATISATFQTPLVFMAEIA